MSLATICAVIFQYISYDSICQIIIIIIIIIIITISSLL